MSQLPLLNDTQIQASKRLGIEPEDFIVPLESEIFANLRLIVDKIMFARKGAIVIAELYNTFTSEMLEKINNEAQKLQKKQKKVQQNTSILFDDSLNGNIEEVDYFGCFESFLHYLVIEYSRLSQLFAKEKKVRMDVGQSHFKQQQFLLSQPAKSNQALEDKEKREKQVLEKRLKIQSEKEEKIRLLDDKINQKLQIANEIQQRKMNAIVSKTENQNRQIADWSEQQQDVIKAQIKLMDIKNNWTNLYLDDFFGENEENMAQSDPSVYKTTHQYGPKPEKPAMDELKLQHLKDSGKKQKMERLIEMRQGFFNDIKLRQSVALDKYTDFKENQIRLSQSQIQNEIKDREQHQEQILKKQNLKRNSLLSTLKKQENDTKQFQQTKGYMTDECQKTQKMLQSQQNRVQDIEQRKQQLQRSIFELSQLKDQLSTMKPNTDAYSKVESRIKYLQEK